MLTRPDNTIKDQDQGQKTTSHTTHFQDRDNRQAIKQKSQAIMGLFNTIRKNVVDAEN